MTSRDNLEIIAQRAAQMLTSVPARAPHRAEIHLRPQESRLWRWTLHLQLADGDHLDLSLMEDADPEEWWKVNLNGDRSPHPHLGWPFAGGAQEELRQAALRRSWEMQAGTMKELKKKELAMVVTSFARSMIAWMSWKAIALLPQATFPLGLLAIIGMMTAFFSAVMASSFTMDRLKARSRGVNEYGEKFAELAARAAAATILKALQAGYPSAGSSTEARHQLRFVASTPEGRAKQQSLGQVLDELEAIELSGGQGGEDKLQIARKMTLESSRLRGEERLHPQALPDARQKLARIRREVDEAFRRNGSRDLRI